MLNLISWILLGDSFLQVNTIGISWKVIPRCFSTTEDFFRERSFGCKQLRRGEPSEGSVAYVVLIDQLHPGRYRQSWNLGGFLRARPLKRHDSLGLGAGTQLEKEMLVAYGAEVHEAHEGERARERESPICIGHYRTLGVGCRSLDR